MAQSPAAAAENYQLKWHSHLNNLNSSVCGLYRNDKFADVVLLTSNQDSGDSGIPAHKIILSTCSYFFSSVFDNNPNLSNNSPLYIVLPPELTKRSVQILIQYMYTGEATVSNEILGEVLKGGEILKIRGLWRNNSPSSGYEPQGKILDSRSDYTTKSSKPLPPPSEKPMSKSQEPRMAPLIVKAPQTSTNAQITTSIQSPTQQQHHHHQQHHQQTLMVKKEMAIDPATTSRPKVQHTQQSSYTIKRNEPTPARIIDNKPSGNRGSFDVDTNNLLLLASQSQSQLRVTKENEQHHNLRQLDRPPFATMKEEQNIREKTLVQPLAAGTESPFKKQNAADPVQIPEALNFLTIKEEPTEWHEFETTEAALKDIVGGKRDAAVSASRLDQQQNQQVVVKAEEERTGLENSSDNEVDEEDEFHSLTCELCSETFAMPSEWVRHIESHSEVSQNLPKKRRRLEEDTSDYTAALRCDLCETYFVTPRDWVRHVQNTHTETELAMSNNSELPKRTMVEVQRNSATSSSESTDMKACSICKKTFPSYASMIIHKRTHTGERPYFCTVKNCKKGFNVKSNLNRHCRTLHNFNLLAAGTSDNPDPDSNSE